jgi:prevent-host-death family protein
MDVSVRDLRNNTAKVIAAVEAGTPVTLTVHGRPVADIVPHGERQERRPAEVVYGELNRDGRIRLDYQFIER